MEGSRLPLPSLLGLFGALLMLSLELLLGMPEDLSNVPVTNPGVRKALAFAVEQYNQDREDSANYFKQLRVLKAQSQVDKRDEYHLKVELMKTECKKNANKTKTYKKIQKCKPLQGNQERPTCYFKVIPGSPPNEMNLAISTCT
ncbi:cystatin-like [Pantherophis guttatus]|uniref:Cystatin-like n=1 Tax=Pantherophis guttatus TaxID=94885 RepID=A0ABM3YR67_PANGU|nr:cystatin-like [Pantherophis guttatus]